MLKLRRYLKSHIKNQIGATAVEYGIMVALIAAVIIVIVTAVGEKTNDAFEKVNSAMTNM